jgi:hypothetical protein
VSLVAKSLLVWAAIIPLAILNGALRDCVLARHLSPAAARFASGLTLSGTIVALVCVVAPWVGRGSAGQFLLLGALWLALTVAFEFAFGRWVARKSWREMVRAYTFQGGDIWPLVLLIVTAAPYLAAWMRGLL